MVIHSLLASNRERNGGVPMLGIQKHVLDLINTATSSLFFFLASVVLAALNHQTGAEIAAVVFGFLVTAVYALNTALGVQRWRLRDSRDGGPQSSEYMRARTASRDLEARSELQ
ncbi:hypothetical protein DNTS_027173 [Danionella cerebrum]|uniref:MARVEL domain-containing protein n=1 Tax=Danionella cerebrum TaxID=2873325 RepID=A0A553N2V7_9TELE|nr:hypothetical protein DNTS_027173 [Danionella translucida]